MRNMLKIVKQDCRTKTGRNLRKLMLVLEKRNVDEISKVDLKNQIYDSIPPGHEWKICIAKELPQIKNNELETDYLNSAELDEILHHILTGHKLNFLINFLINK